MTVFNLSVRRTFYKGLRCFHVTSDFYEYSDVAPLKRDLHLKAVSRNREAL